MKEHIKVTYEAIDGTIFEDDMKCLNYEMNLLYERSGVRFTYKNGKAFKKIDIDGGKYGWDDSYGLAHGVKIDRSKEKENEVFIDAAIENCGWILLGSIKNGSETKYRFIYDEDKYEDKLIPLD